MDEDGNLQERPEQDEIDENEDDDSEESESEQDDEERDADFKGANTRSRTAGGSRRGRGGARGKASGGRSSASRAGAGRGRPREQQQNDTGGDEGENADQAEGSADAARGKDDFSVEPDNTLFSEYIPLETASESLPSLKLSISDTVKDPRAALEATAEDWLENYRSDEDTRGQALADLVNFVLRVCLLSSFLMLS